MEAYKKMRIEYTRLFNKLKENNLTQKEFKIAANIGGGTMQKLINNESVTLEIICRICDYFQCMPDEIMEFIPDSNYIEKQQAKQEVQAQIAELQAKLKTM
jgi:DNA-binding Xre family transcriptional regulator|nr:MAG TPA: Cro/C1-type HTH DNA-binding domain protein [Caudoviricetes sp.]DAX83629.1 MAG TPA: Cro/C1-type HTH DNA-binding domain protein [Caudoviricetes sp.]